MKELGSHLSGSWRTGEGDALSLVNPATERPLATVRPASQTGPALAWARDIGGPNLRALSFARRAELLSAVSKAIYEHREELIGIAVENGGNTRGDAKFDIDGGLAVLAAYAELGARLGDAPWLTEGEPAPLSRGGKLRAQHVLSPRHGVAVHVNAFNFPAWGLLGKAAVAWLAGMPVLSKPATSTALLAHRIAEILAASGLLPEGAFQLLVGPVGDLFDHLAPQDVIAFTGSATTGAKVRSHPAVLGRGVRVNLETDSLNAAVVGPDVAPGSELFDVVVRDCTTEIGQKAGQKCTATRRLLVPGAQLQTVREVLVERLQEIADRTGDPADAGVRMGPLATRQQLDDARAGVGRLVDGARILRGDPQRRGFSGVEAGQGYFLEPILLEADPDSARDPRSACHHTEVFGPVCTLLPYDGTVEEAARLVAYGGGSLVSTVYSDDREFTARAVAQLGPQLGRLVIVDEKSAGAALPPGCVLPLTQHGGPGRAGDGAELGGRQGLSLYMQRTAVQGGASQLARLLGHGD